MTIKNSSTSYFIKNEASYSVNNGASNYTLIGSKICKPKGNFEVGLAFKESKTSLGGFIEGKYTSPKNEDANWSLESRTRLQGDFPYDKEKASFSLAQRIAGKGSWDIDKGVNFYQIFGLNSKISLQGDGLQSLTPTSITGFGYDLNKKLNVYIEGELSKGYDFQKKSWNDLSPAVYLGAKYTF